MEPVASRKRTQLCRSYRKRNVLSKLQAPFQRVLAPRKTQLSRIFDGENQFIHSQKMLFLTFCTRPLNITANRILKANFSCFMCFLQNLEHVMIEPLFLVFLSSPAGFRGASSKEGTSAQIQSSQENPWSFYELYSFFNAFRRFRVQSAFQMSADLAAANLKSQKVKLLRWTFLLTNIQHLLIDKVFFPFCRFVKI